jgi:phosphate uptake regulator
MLKDLLQLFRTDDAVARMGDGFAEMMEKAREVTLMAGTYFFERRPTQEERGALIEADVQVNKLQRKIRKQIAAHLVVGGGGADAAYGLLLMSILKDAERIGDYAKNISEVHDEGGAPVPAPGDPVGDELRSIRDGIEGIFGETPDVLESWDPAEAADLIEAGVALTRRADALIPAIAAGNYDTATTVTLVLGARHYKRVAGHLLNVLSGVVMPLHKLDYYDEDVLTRLVESKDGEENSEEEAEEEG